MSFQPQPTPPAQGARRTPLLVLGIVLLLAGLGAGAALYINAGSKYDDAVKNLQRAPVGCDTEFNFTGTGTFIFYVETKGKIGTVKGDCGSTNSNYNHGSKAPKVTLNLTDKNGDSVDLIKATSASYDTAGYVGTQTRSLKIDKPGKYTLSVSSDDTDFAIAVGRNPKDDFDNAQKTAIGAIAIGLILGALFIILGLRRKPVPTAPNAWGQTVGTNVTGYQPVGSPPGGYQPAGPPIAQPAWQPAPQEPFQQPAPPAPPPPPPPPTPPSSWGAPQQ